MRHFTDGDHRNRRIAIAETDRWRGATAATRVYEITRSRDPRSELVTDADSWLLELAIRDHGALLRLRRRR